MSKNSRRFDWLPVIVFIILISSTLVIFKIYNDYLYEKNYALFDNETDLIKLKIEQRLDLYGQILESGRAFIEVSDEINRSDWKVFVESQNILNRYPGVQGVAIVKHTTDENEFLKDMQELKSNSLLNRDVPSRSYDGAYNYVFLIEPVNERNLYAYGFDITTEPTRRLSFEKARDTNDFSLSNRITLVQEIDEDKQFGFLFNLPFYEKGKQISSVDERRENFLGIVNMPFRITDFMENVLEEDFPHIEMKIYDGKISDDNFMYSNEYLGFQNSSDVIFNKELEINIFGNLWTLSFGGTESLISHEEILVGYLIIAIGLVISVFSFFLISLYRKPVVINETELENKKFVARNIVTIIFITSGAIILLIWYGVILQIVENPDDLIEHTSQNIGTIQTRENLESELSEPTQALIEWYREIKDKEGFTYLVETKYLAKDIQSDEVIWELTIPELMNGLTRQYIDKEGHITFPNHLEKKNYRVYDLGGEVLNYDFSKELVVEGLQVYEFTGTTTFDISDEYPEFYPNKIFEDYTSVDYVEPLTGTAISYKENFVDYTIIDGEKRPILIVENWPTNFSQQNSINIANYYKSLYIFYEFVVPLIIISILSVIYIIFRLSKKIFSETLEIRSMREAGKNKNLMISMVHHELKNPMQPILLSAEMLQRDETLSAKQKDRVKVILSGLDQMNFLLNDFRELERLDRNKMKFNMQKEDLRELIDEIITKFKPTAESKNISLNLDMEGTWTLVMDKKRIEQVISNILQNAIDFVLPDSGKISVKVQRQDESTLISIQDNGPGIAPELAEQVFDEFYQIKSPSNAHRKGIGLGLAICKKIIEVHGGKIWVDTGYSSGARFCITIPEKYSEF